MGCKVFMESSLCTGRYYWKPSYDFLTCEVKQGTKLILDILIDRVKQPDQLYLVLFWPKEDRLASYERQTTNHNSNIFAPDLAQWWPSISVFMRSSPQGKPSKYETGYKMVKHLKTVLRLINDGNDQLNQLLETMTIELFENENKWTERGNNNGFMSRLPAGFSALTGYTI